MSVKQMSNGIAVVDKNSVVLLIFSNRRKIITINQNDLPYHTSMGDNTETAAVAKEVEKHCITILRIGKPNVVVIAGN